MDAHPRHDVRANANHRIAAIRLRLLHQSIKRVVTRVIEDVGVFGDLAALEAFQCAQKPATHAHGIGYIAKCMRHRLIACVHMTIEFLRTTGTGEEPTASLCVHARAHEQKFGGALKIAELTRHAHNAIGLGLFGFGDHPVIGTAAPSGDGLCHLRHFSA